MCFEPKTPLGISRGLIHRLGEGDVKELARSATVPPGLQKEAKGILERLAKKRGKK